MTMRRQSLRFWLAGAASLTCLAAAMPAMAQTVTQERLNSPEPENWLLPHGNYGAWSYSSLDEINTGNVGDLRVMFMTAVGGSDPSSLGGSNAGQRGWSVVNDGMMYTLNAWAQVVKIDVSSGTVGRPLWINDPEFDSAQPKFGAPALLGDYVYNATRGSMRLIKIDAETGETIWNVSTRGPDNIETAERNSGSALAVNGQIIVGAAGPGMRGWVGAFDGETGDLAWRFYTIPGPGEFGHETWADDHNAYLTGGGGVWTTPTYDPVTNLVYVGTGEPQPWGDPTFRPGDNLFTVSTLAIDADTGQLAWHFQEIPDESWDYDTVNPKMLYEIVVAGEPRNVLANFSRNGHFYTMDRGTGEFLFAQAYRDDLNWTAGIDAKTGLPIEYNPNALIQSYGNNMSLVVGDPTSAQNVCPSLSAPTWWPPTYDPTMQMAWVQTIDQCFSQSIAEGIDPNRNDLLGNGMMWGAGSPWDFSNRVGSEGLIIGMDATTGDKVQQLSIPTAATAGLLGTAGGLLFMGHPDGTLAAYDKATLNEVWRFNVGTPITSPPISYAVNGKQYIAVLAGGSAGGPNGILGQASQIVVFGL